MIVRKALPNDRYILNHVGRTQRKERSKVLAEDQMKPWCPPGGVSDDMDNANGGDNVELLTENSTDLDEQDGRNCKTRICKLKNFLFLASVGVRVLQSGKYPKSEDPLLAIPVPTITTMLINKVAGTEG